MTKRLFTKEIEMCFKCQNLYRDKGMRWICEEVGEIKTPFNLDGKCIDDRCKLVCLNGDYIHLLHQLPSPQREDWLKSFNILTTAELSGKIQRLIIEYEIDKLMNMDAYRIAFIMVKALCDKQEQQKGKVAK